MPFCKYYWGLGFGCAEKQNSFPTEMTLQVTCSFGLGFNVLLRSRGSKIQTPNPKTVEGNCGGTPCAHWAYRVPREVRDVSQMPTRPWKHVIRPQNPYYKQKDRIKHVHSYR